jgi:hypothetical protein
MDLEFMTREEEGRRLSRGRGRLASLAAVYAALGGIEGAWDRGTSTVETPLRRCALPGCDKPANRGGYCCAEHCREARELDRKARGFTR